MTGVEEYAERLHEWQQEVGNPSDQDVEGLIASAGERFAGPIVAALLDLDPHWPLRPDPPQHLILALRCLPHLPPDAALLPLHHRAAHTVTALLTAAHAQEGGGELALVQLLKTTLPGVFERLGPQWVAAPRYRTWWIHTGRYLSAAGGRTPFLAATLDLALAPAQNG